MCCCINSYLLLYIAFSVRLRFNALFISIVFVTISTLHLLVNNMQFIRSLHCDWIVKFPGLWKGGEWGWGVGGGRDRPG